MASGLNDERVRRSRSDWLALFEAQRRSGLSQQRFCRQQGISTSAFYNARSRYEWNAPEGEAVSVEDFVSLSVPQARGTPGWDIELSLGGDVVLRLRRS